MTEADIQGIFSRIDDRRDEYLERLFAYLRMPSISSEGIGIEETAAEMERVGLRARIVRASTGSPMVFGEWTGAARRPTVLFYGHYDVQPAGDLELWHSPPFEPTVRNGRIYARGAGDNKGQHFAQLLAIETLLRSNNELPCNVKVLLEGEEETGSPSLLDFVREHRAELQTDLVVTNDGPQSGNNAPMLEFGARGVISFELRARGANRDLHSGNWGGIAPNPIWSLVHLLATMKNSRGEITINGLSDNVLPMTELEQSALDALPVDLDAVKDSLEIAELDQPLERGFYERLSAYPTLTINGFHGGYGGPGSMTVLPHEAIVKCDVRLVEAQTAADVYAKIEGHVQRHAPQVEIVHQGSMDPSRTPLDSPFAAPIKRAIRAGQGAEPSIMPAMGGSLPDYVFTKTLGVPAFTVPYANADEANHAPDENITIDHFIRGIKTGVAMMMELGSEVRGDG